MFCLYFIKVFNTYIKEKHLKQHNNEPEHKHLSERGSEEDTLLKNYIMITEQ